MQRLSQKISAVSAQDTQHSHMQLLEEKPTTIIKDADAPPISDRL